MKIIAAFFHYKTLQTNNIIQMHTKQILLLICFFTFAFSCKKEDKPNNSNNNNPTLKIIAADTFFVTNDTTFALDVRGEGSEQTDLHAVIGTMPNHLSTMDMHTTFAHDAFARFNIHFNQFDATPGIMYFDIMLSYANINFEAIEKRIYLVYQPKCGYQYKDYVNGSITYTINQELQQKTIWCSYATSGNLLVENLTPYTMEWIFDCSNQSFTMKPQTYMGIYKTLKGTKVGDELRYTLYDNDVISATGVIRP